MATNHYFNNIRANTEQALLEDLVIETIKIHGMDVYYLPRTAINRDKLFGEDLLASFTNTIPVEMYLETVNGFEGPGDLLTKFGLSVKDSASMVVSKLRFQKETGMERPMEGDIIYIPLSKGLFEIKFVEHENPFFQLGKNYTFKLSVELFQFSEEQFSTGETDIDSISAQNEFRLYVSYGNTGSILQNFAIGDLVYQYTNGLTTGSYTGANATGIVAATGNSQVILRNIIGDWKNSSTVNRYVTKQNNSIYRIVTGITDRVQTDIYNDNLNIQTSSDSLLDFNDSNPFGDP